MRFPALYGWRPEESASRLRPGSASDALFVDHSRRGCGTVCAAGVRCEERDEVACTVVTADRLHECVSLLQAEA